MAWNNKITHYKKNFLVCEIAIVLVTPVSLSLYIASVLVKLCTKGIVQCHGAFSDFIPHFIRHSINPSDHFPHTFLQKVLRAVLVYKCPHSPLLQCHLSPHRVRSAENWLLLFWENTSFSLAHDETVLCFIRYR